MFISTNYVYPSDVEPDIRHGDDSRRDPGEDMNSSGTYDPDREVWY